MDENTEYENYRKRLEEFPCAFNLTGADNVTMAKFRSIQHNLDSELAINDNCENERIIKLNLLTWVRFRQEKQEEAVQLSNDAVNSTGRRNVASLGNRFFVMWQRGDEIEAKKCLEDLEKMKSEENYHTQFIDAQAEQAYYYSRLGGPSSLKRAIDIFSALPEPPINYLRKFGCGLVYHRMTHVNIFCSSSNPLTVPDYQKLAAECLFKVADNADSRLRSLAYAQLVNLRRSYSVDRSLFRGLGVMQLCDKALEHGKDIPTVLAQCGKAIKPIDIDKAIEWLKKSVEIKDNSPAYHHLGICYKRKAELAARGNPHPKNTSEELRDHDSMGQQDAESQVTGQSHDVTRTSRDEHRRPTDRSTAYHQANRAAMHVMKEYPQVNYTREHCSTRRGNRNSLPQYKGGRYGPVDDQTRQSSNRYGEGNYQHRETTNYQHGETNYQVGETNYQVGETNYQIGETNYQVGETNYQVGETNYKHGETNYQVGETNYQHGETNYQVGETNYQHGETNYQVGETNYQHGETNYQVGETNYQHGETNYQVGETNYQHGETNYQHGETNYELGETNYQHGETNYELGEINYELGETNYQLRETNYHHGETNYQVGETNYELGETNYQLGETNYELGETNYQHGETNYELGETNYQLRETNYQHGETNYQVGETNYQHGETNYQHGETNYELGETNYQHGETNYQHVETNYQHLPSNYQYQQISGQRGYRVDEHGYLSHLPSQVINTHGSESYYSSQMNYTHTQMNHRPLDMSQTFGQTYGQTAYMGVDDGHWDNQNVQVDSASCVNDNAESYGACGSIHDKTVVESMPSASSYVDLIRGPITDSENYYIDGNVFYIDNINWEQNKATENNTITYPMVETQTGPVQHVSDMPFHWYDHLQYKPVPDTYSTHESQGPGCNAPNLGFRPSIAGNMYSTPWNAGRIKYVQNMRGGRGNARSRGGFRESGRITSGSHCDSEDASSNFGSSRRSIDCRRQSARDIGLVHENAQRTGRHVRNNNHNGRTFSGGRWEPKANLKSSLRMCRSVIPLNKDDENVQKAHNCFTKAIEIAKENLSAALDLGLLLKVTNQIDEALKQFNSITNNSNPSIGHRVTVISAFEQAGLCYLQLSQIEGNKGYQEMAKNKLTRAVSMAADLALIMPELQGSHKDVWIAFTTLITEIDKEQVPKNIQVQQTIKVLELAREHGDIIDVIQKLKEIGQEELNNPDIIKTALDSYLQLKQPDNALAFHNLVSMNPAVKGSDWWNANPMRSLRVKVLLHVISGLLRELSDSPTVLFQQLFELVFGSCSGLRDPENDQQNDTNSVVFGDVLFVFDTDENPEEESMYPTVKSARCLKRLSTWLFGLETQENMKGTGEYGGNNQIQHNEMLKYQVVIIVLGKETRDGIFNAMLEGVSYNNRELAPPNQKILVIDTSLHGGEIPQCLQQFKSLKLGDIGILDQLQTAPESWSESDHISFTDIINHVDVDAILQLFCFMIEQTWNCP